MAELSNLPDLVRDTRLSVKFYKEKVTIHRRRYQQQQELWYRNKLLGAGGGGQVWLEQEIEQNGTKKQSFRAVKQIASHTSPVTDYVRELEAIAKFSQDKFADYFVKSHGWFQGPEALYIAMEYCPCGDLNKYLGKNKRLPESEAQIVMRQVLIGLLHMHEEKFAHRDLKPANILVISHPPDEWIVKLGDFGLSKRTTGIESTTVRGTPGFLPPELLMEHARQADPFFADIWCVGETAHQLVTGKAVFEGYPELQAYMRDSNAFPLEALTEFNASENLVSFIQGVMKANPRERPSPQQALGWRWLALATESPQLPHIEIDSLPPSPIPDELIAPSAAWTTVTAPGEDPFTLPEPASPTTASGLRADSGDDDTELPTHETASIVPSSELPSEPTLQSLAVGSISSAPSPTPSAQTRVNDADDGYESANETERIKSPSKQTSGWLFRTSNLDHGDAPQAMQTSNLDHGDAPEAIHKRSASAGNGPNDRTIDQQTSMNSTRRIDIHKELVGDSTVPPSQTAASRRVSAEREPQLVIREGHAPEHTKRATVKNHAQDDQSNNTRNTATQSEHALIFEIYQSTPLYRENRNDHLHWREFNDYARAYAQTSKPWPTVDAVDRSLRGEPMDAVLEEFLTGFPYLSQRCEQPGCQTLLSKTLSTTCGGCGEWYCDRHKARNHHACAIERAGDKRAREPKVRTERAEISDDKNAPESMPTTTGARTQGGSQEPKPVLSDRSTIELVHWAEPNSKRRRPYFTPILRSVDRHGGEIRIERWRGDSETDPQVIGFKTKVVSRDHGRLLCRSGQWFIQDSGSTSGTWLNNRRLSAANVQSTKQPLRDGDLVQLGMDYTGASDEEIYGCVFFRVRFPPEQEVSGTPSALSEDRRRNSEPSQDDYRSPRLADERLNSDDKKSTQPDFGDCGQPEGTQVDDTNTPGKETNDTIIVRRGEAQQVGFGEYLSLTSESEDSNEDLRDRASACDPDRMTSNDPGQVTQEAALSEGDAMSLKSYDAMSLKTYAPDRNGKMRLIPGALWEAIQKERPGDAEVRLLFFDFIRKLDTGDFDIYDKWFMIYDDPDAMEAFRRNHRPGVGEQERKGAEESTRLRTERAGPEGHREPRSRGSIHDSQSPETPFSPPTSEHGGDGQAPMPVDGATVEHMFGPLKPEDFRLVPRYMRLDPEYSQAGPDSNDAASSEQKLVMDSSVGNASAIMGGSSQVGAEDQGRRMQVDGDGLIRFVKRPPAKGVLRRLVSQVSSDLPPLRVKLTNADLGRMGSPANWTDEAIVNLLFDKFLERQHWSSSLGDLKASEMERSRPPEVKWDLLHHWRQDKGDGQGSDTQVTVLSAHDVQQMRDSSPWNTMKGYRPKHMKIRD